MRHSGHEPRIAFVSHAVHRGGAETVLLSLTGAMGPRCSVTLLADGPLRATIAAQGVRCVVPPIATDLSRIRRDTPMLRALLPTLRGLLRSVRLVARSGRDADVVYANSQKAFVVAGVAKLFSRRPLVWHLHDILDAQHFGAGQVRLVVLLANLLAAAVVVPSGVAARTFVAAGGRASLVRTVPNGLDAAPADGRDRAVLRRELGLPDVPVIGVFSRIARWKGQHLALDATAVLPGVYCLLVGGPLFGEDAYDAELRRRADELGIADRVVLAGDRDDARALMRAVDVCVHPSVLDEPFGLTVIEAMSGGLPVVASRRGAPAEIITHAVDGMLFDPDDPDALPTALRTLLADPALAASIASRAAERAADFSSAAMVSGVEAVVREAADGRRPRPWSGLSKAAASRPTRSKVAS